MLPSKGHRLCLLVLIHTPFVAIGIGPAIPECTQGEAGGVGIHVERPWGAFTAGR